MQVINHNSELPLQPKTFKRLIAHSLKSVGLIMAMILLVGHNNINPHTDDSRIELYSSKMQSLLNIQTSYILDSENNSIDAYLDKMIKELYHSRGFLPIWTTNYSANHVLDSALNLISNARHLGFPDDYFQIETTRNYIDVLNNCSREDSCLDIRVALEIHFSRSFLQFMVYINQGIVSEIDSNLDSDIANFANLLNTSLGINKLDEAINSIHPKGFNYVHLIKATPSFLHTIDQIATHKINIADSLISLALFYTNIIPAPCFDSANTKHAAISKFQKLHKLEQTGTIDSTTYAKLSDQLEYKYYQLCLNLDRLRKLETHNDDYLLVNIPEFKLHVFEKNKLQDEYVVVVGKTQTKTPILSSSINKIVTNPYWTVPKSITNNEMLYKIRKDSTYLSRNGYYVIDYKEDKVCETAIDWTTNNPLGNKYWIRQKNSRKNALGQVKFLFPNNYNVYLHDTPSKRYFKREKRAYSHGCIRVQNPEKLAQYLTDKLNADEKDPVNIKSEINSKKRKIFQLERSIDIHIHYITSVANQNGELCFLNDVYKKDQKEIQALFVNYGNAI